MSWLSNWIDGLLVKRVLGLLVRRAIDFVAGALLTVSCFGTNICESFASWLSENATEAETFIIAGILAIVSILWSFTQKRTDIKTIRSS